MFSTFSVDVNHTDYSIIEGTGDTIYIEPTSDWVEDFRAGLQYEFEARLSELEHMYSVLEYSPEDFTGWDNSDDVAEYLNLLKSSSDLQLLAEAWTFSTVWCWVKVVNNNTGDVVFEADGNGV